MQEPHERPSKGYWRRGRSNPTARDTTSPPANRSRRRGRKYEWERHTIYSRRGGRRLHAQATGAAEGKATAAGATGAGGTKHDHSILPPKMGQGVALTEAAGAAAGIGSESPSFTPAGAAVAQRQKAARAAEQRLLGRRRAPSILPPELRQAGGPKSQAAGAAASLGKEGGGRSKLQSRRGGRRRSAQAARAADQRLLQPMNDHSGSPTVTERAPG